MDELAITLNAYVMCPSVPATCGAIILWPRIMPSVSEPPDRDRALVLEDAVEGRAVVARAPQAARGGRDEEAVRLPRQQLEVDDAAAEDGRADRAPTNP